METLSSVGVTDLDSVLSENADDEEMAEENSETVTTKKDERKIVRSCASDIETFKITSPTTDDDASSTRRDVKNEASAVTKEPPAESELLDKAQSELGTVREYLKKHDGENLTFEDLEEICVQKVCEAIGYNSEFATRQLGELRHQIGLQKQMAERWRKEAAQLSKQARDLEFVNKKLLHEVRLKNEREKPLVPVKIKRSVGLQVCSDMLPNVAAAKQRRLNITPQTSSLAFNQKPQIRSNQKNCLRYQALQNATNATATPARKRVKKPAMTTKSVIDLTDEDTATKTKSAMVSKAVTASTGVRILTSTIIKPGVLASGQVVSTTNTSRFKNPHNQFLTADGKPANQKVMLEIGSGNGVLASVANGSAIAVNTTARTAQQVSLLKLTSQQGTASVTTTTNSITRAPASKVHVYKHPAPLTASPFSNNSQPARKPIPPKPHLSIKRSGGAIVLFWWMPYNLDNFESIVSYQLYVYQETTSSPSSEMWRKVWKVKALALPMTCTLTQFVGGCKYHFAVRAVDVHERKGPFCSPEKILL